MIINEDHIRIDERRKISQELHDNLAHEILNLQFLFLKSEPNLDPEMFSQINRKIDFIRRSVRSLSHKYSIEANHLEATSLSEAVKDLIIDSTYIFDMIVFDFFVFPKPLELTLDTIKTNELLLILKELIQNAVIHGKPSNICISLTDHEDELILMVEDNGNGFDQKKVSSGIGIKNCIHRLNAISGAITIDSTLQKGTSISIHIKK